MIKDLIKRTTRRKIIAFLSPFVFTLFFIVLAVMGASYVVDVVKDFFSNAVDGFTGVFKKDILVWSDSLTEEEINEWIGSGVNIHPQKFSKYIGLENKSIPQKAETKRMSWYAVYDRKVNEWLDTSSSPVLYDYELPVDEGAYPYRLFYESLLGVDFINNTSEKKDELVILNKAGKDVDHQGLASVFDWGFNYTETIINDLLYYDIDYNSFEYEETIFISYYTKTKTYRNGSLVSTKETQEDERHSYPLPYLNSVKTMFKDYEFTYEKVILEDKGWEQIGEPIIQEWTTEEFAGYDSEGNPKYRTVHWKSITINEEKKKIEKDLPLPYSAVDNTNFPEFFKDNKLDLSADPYLIHELVTHFPDSMDYTMLLQEFLDLEFSNLDYANLELNYDIDTSDSMWLEDIPYIYQTDPRWKNLPYGREGTVGGSGCGPSSLAIVIQAYRNAGYNLNISSMDLDNDGIVNPYEVCVWSAKNGYRAYGKGSYWTLFSGAGKALGLNVIEVGKTEKGAQQVLEALSKGNLVIASMSRGEFTKGGHFITLAGIDANKKIIVRDSNSASRSKTAYNFEYPIFAQANGFWIIYP